MKSQYLSCTRGVAITRGVYTFVRAVQTTEIPDEISNNDRCDELTYNGTRLGEMRSSGMEPAMQKRRKARRMTSCRTARAGYSPNGIRIDRALLAGLGDGDRWMVGGLVSPGSTVRRLTSVRGFYYDVLESCGVRRNEGSYSLPHANSLPAKSLAPFCPVPLGSHDLRPPIFTPFFVKRRRVYIMREKKNLTPRANWKERSL